MCTPADVKAITGSTLDDAVVQVFIDAAECLISNSSACITGQGITEDCQDQACAFLSAHLMVSSAVGQDSGIVKKESLAGKYSVEYVVSSADMSGIKGTPYGQTANAMLGGCIAEADKTPVGLFSIGGVGRS